MNTPAPGLKEKFWGIRLLAMDVDGVLTDGGVYIHEDGGEFRRFNIKDGQGIKRVIAQGILVAAMSSSSNQAVLHRMQQLGVEDVYLGVDDKLQKLRELCDRFSISLEEVCYIGDDLADLQVMGAVGLACAPADAAAEIRQIAAYITEAKGGQGAVREVCDVLIYV